jgi:hypothetical protein
MTSTTTTDIAASNSLADLGGRINEAHCLAMRHAGEAVAHAIACGQMLLEAKAKVPHGQWLPWLRNNITFGERSAQGYMRIAQRLPNPQRVADLPLRRVLGELRTPLRAGREAREADLEAWIEQNRAARKPVEDWTVEDAQACIHRIRAFDEIMHRYGICPWAGTPDSDLCLVCTPPRPPPDPSPSHNTTTQAQGGQS